MKKRFVITGGAGFIGTNLSEYLVSEGYDVLVVDDLSAGDAKRLPSQVVFHQLDIRHTDKLTSVLAEGDIIVHLAALPRVQFSIDNPIIAHDVNVNGTLSVLEAAKRAAVARVVFAASSSAYGDQTVMPLSVTMTPQPQSPYALQKYIGETYMKLWSELYGIDTVSLRFFNVYGPHLDPNGPYALVIGLFLKLAAEGKPLTITGDGSQTRDFTHVRDVVSAIVKAGLHTQPLRGTVLNVGAGTQTSINELAALISDSVTYVPARLEPKHTLADISQTELILQWKPTTQLADGIRELKQSFAI